MTRALTVLATGPLTTVQDTGRTGQAALGIGRSGACDRASAALANRLLGNPPDAAVLEVTFGGLALRAMDAAGGAARVEALERALKVRADQHREAERRKRKHKQKW